jgi:hypothetical protein
MLATGGGGGGRSSQKNFPVISKKFSVYTTFFLKYEKNFPDIPKKFPDIWYFSRKWKHFSGNNIDSSFQKYALVKKCNLNDIFHARKGHFAPGKRALGKTWGEPGPPGPPGSYAPASHTWHHVICFFYSSRTIYYMWHHCIMLCLIYQTININYNTKDLWIYYTYHIILLYI